MYRKAVVNTAYAFVPVFAAAVAWSRIKEEMHIYQQLLVLPPPLAKTKKLASCYPPATIGENGLTNGLCYLGNSMEAHGKHMSMGLESHGKHIAKGMSQGSGYMFLALVVSAFIVSKK
jgi:hypothetical protein